MNEHYLEVLGIEKENYTDEQLEEICELFKHCKNNLRYDENQIYLASDYPTHTNDYELLELVGSKAINGKFDFCLAVVYVPTYKETLYTELDKVEEELKNCDNDDDYESLICRKGDLESAIAECNYLNGEEYY